MLRRAIFLQHIAIVLKERRALLSWSHVLSKSPYFTNIVSTLEFPLPSADLSNMDKSPELYIQ